MKSRARKYKCGFTLIEAVCVTLLLACVSVVAFSLTDTFTTSIRYAKDVLIYRINQHNFLIALDRMSAKTDHVLFIDNDGICASQSFPRVPAPYDASVYSEMSKRGELSQDIDIGAISLASVPTWEMEPSSSATITSARFVFYGCPTPYSGVALGDILGSLVLSFRDTANGKVYATADLYAGDNVTDAQRIAGYEVELKFGVPGDYFIKTIQYWPLLGGYSVALPSIMASVAACNTSQLNVYRYGIFLPDIYFLH